LVDRGKVDEEQLSAGSWQEAEGTGWAIGQEVDSSVDEWNFLGESGLAW
jgi:hypothetical protein